MSCLVCGNKVSHYFSKIFNCYNLNKVDYYICENCQFVFSKTHYEMNEHDWIKLNNEYHSYLKTSSNPDDPNWNKRINNQINLIRKWLPKNSSILDFAAGSGIFSKHINNIKNYDPYFEDDNYITKLETYDTIINTSYLEHIKRYEDIDNLFKRVDKCLFLHTYCDKIIPKDPNWFYLLPIHCSFYSEKSLQILFERYNFKCSLYDFNSRMWVLFKYDVDGLEKRFIGFNP